MNKKIVIVDDEVHIRALLQQTLEDLEDDYNVELFTAENGREGLKIITEEKPDLVLLDVMMPLMNGYEVCEAVTRNPDLEGVKVVLLTAKGQEADRERGFSAGATEYMTKPFDPDDVVRYAKSALGLGE